MNFNVNELSNTINTIESIAGGDNTYSLSMRLTIYGEQMEKIGDAVTSEDSNLSRTCFYLGTTISNITKKLEEVCGNIIKEITVYARETLGNEEGTTKSLEEINGELASIDKVLKSL